MRILVVFQTQDSVWIFIFNFESWNSRKAVQKSEKHRVINTVKALFAGTLTIHIENNRTPITSCNKCIFSSIRVSGFNYGHSMNSPFHHVTVSFLILEVDLNTVLVPLWFNIIFVDFKFNFSSLSLNYL